jgi:hypothetical protein
LYNIWKWEEVAVAEKHKRQEVRTCRKSDKVFKTRKADEVVSFDDVDLVNESAQVL